LYARRSQNPIASDHFRVCAKVTQKDHCKETFRPLETICADLSPSRAGKPRGSSRGTPQQAPVVCDRGTSLPASIFQLPQRGIIRANYFADVVVFDEPTGIDYVIVNGVVAVTPKGLTGARPGTRLVHRTTPR